MIRLLNERDNEIVINYLLYEKEINLFILGDIKNYGFSTDFQKVWGEFDDLGNLKGVLLKYYDSFIFYSKDNFDIEGFSDIIKKNKCKIFSGKSSILSKFENNLNFKDKREMFFCKLDNLDKIENFKCKNIVKKITLDDVDNIVNLFFSIDEFTNINRESIIRKYKDNSGRGYCIYKDNVLVSMAQTTAENKYSAMIVGVATHKNYRKNGYATDCMVTLCKELLKENKTLCLFYDNPKAGRIYKRIGFEDIGLWSMFELKD